MLSARKAMDVVSVYLDVGSFNAAGEIRGVVPKNVKQIVAAHEVGGLEEGCTRRRRLVAKNTDVVRDLVVKRVSDRRARITAERLLPKARSAGMGGRIGTSAVWLAAEKKAWRAQNGRQCRPAVWVPGERPVIDWGRIPGTGTLVFGAVLVWSRVRFVRFARDETAASTLSLLAEYFETFGGVPAKVPADRMGCLKGWQGPARYPGMTTFTTREQPSRDFLVLLAVTILSCGCGTVPTSGWTLSTGAPLTWK